jgi:outer membrane protein assembly factor BamB
VRWVAPLPDYENMEKKKDPITWAGPVLAGSQLIVLSSSGVAMFLSPQDGKTVWQTELSDKGYLGPVIADNTLYLLTDDANLSAYR